MEDVLDLFRWQDALDILILTYIFYRLYLWLRRKRALRMVLVILALPFFYFIARWIDLPLSVWGLQNLWAAILLVLVVIFQKEIREVLGSITLPGFLSGKPSEPPLKGIDILAGAAFRMAGRGQGGLIVLQKRDTLEEFIHGETRLDAEMNEDLLVSIFNPQSPLHDGAVIVQGDRIRYATALLPVSQSRALPRQWGTRHRAAIGITEVSDAKCVIISEERREVLLFQEGRYEKEGRKEDLEKALLGLPPIPEPKDRRARWFKNLFADLPRKAFFLILVGLLWVFVIGIRQGEISFSVPLEYYSTPPSLELGGEPPREIKVRLKGSQRLLSSVKPDQIRVEVNLSNLHPGINQIPVSETNITVPSGLTVTSIYPRNIRIQLSSLPNSHKK